MVDYAFYAQQYNGSAIEDNEWRYYEARAAEKLEQYKRAYKVTEPAEQAEMKAVCAMADALHNFDVIANGSGPVNSASIGSVSVSYGSKWAEAVDISPKGQAKELYRCALLYLDICRGVG